MDNILKLIMGCLGLIGLVVMILPNADPLASANNDTEVATASTGAVNGTAAASAPQAQAPNAVQEAPASEGEFVVDDYDINNFGKPMVDPTPPAQRNQNPVQEQNQQPANDMPQSPTFPGNSGQPPIIARSPAPVAPIPPST
jgi:hypothetical protein